MASNPPTVSKRQAFFFLLLSLALHFDLFLLGPYSVYFGHDTFDVHLPHLNYFRQTLWEHGLSFWNPAILGGTNAVLNARSFLSPEWILGLFMPPHLVVAFFYTSITFLAGIGMFLYVKSTLRFSEIASAFSAVVFALHFHTYTIGWGLVLLPFIFHFFDRAIEEQSVRFLGLTAIIITTAFYTCISQYIVLWGLFHVCFLGWKWSMPVLVKRVFPKFVLVWALGLIGYFPVLLPQLELLPYSQRMIWDLPAIGTLPFGWEDLLSYLWRLVLPDGSAIQDSIYIGLIPAYFLYRAVRQFRLKNELGDSIRCFVLLLLGMVLFSLLVSPLLPSLASDISFLKSFSVLRIWGIYPFLITVLVACGVEILIREKGEEKVFAIIQTRQFLVGMIAIWILLYVGLVAFRGSLHQGIRSIELQGIHHATILALLLLLTNIGLREKFFNICQTLGAKLLPFAGGPRLVWAVLFVVALDLGLTNKLTTYKHIDFLQFIKYENESFEVLKSLPGSRVFRTALLDYHPNLLMHHGFLAAGGYQSIYPLRFHEFWASLIKPRLTSRSDLKNYFLHYGARTIFYTWGIWGTDIPGSSSVDLSKVLDRELLNFHGVKYVLTSRPIKDAEKRDWTLIVEGEKSGQNVDPTRDAREAFRRLLKPLPRFFLYENRSVFPRAFVNFKAASYASRADLMASIEEASDMQLREVTPLLVGDIDKENFKLSSGSHGRVEITKYAPDEISLTVDTNGNGILTLTDNYAPGWQCEVDGIPRPIFYTYNSFRGIQIFPGDRHVIFRYIPIPMILGFVCAFIAMTVAFLMVWRGRRTQPIINHIVRRVPLDRPTSSRRNV